MRYGKWVHFPVSPRHFDFFNRQVGCVNQTHISSVFLSNREGKYHFLVVELWYRTSKFTITVFMDQATSIGSFVSQVIFFNFVSRWKESSLSSASFPMLKVIFENWRNLQNREIIKNTSTVRYGTVQWQIFWWPRKISNKIMEWRQFMPLWIYLNIHVISYCTYMLKYANY